MLSDACRDLRRDLHPFLDRELAPDRHAASAAHLSACPDCAALVRRHRELAREVRQAMAEAAPDGLRARLVARWRRRRRVRSFACALAAAAVLAIALLLARGGDRGLDDDDIREVADLHHRSLLPGHLTAAPGGDPAALAAWFHGRLPFTPWVGRVDGDGYALLGARLDWCDHQQVATLVFRRQDHVITLLSYPAERPGDRPPAGAARDGLALCGWVQRRMQYVVVSDLPRDDVSRFSALVRERIASD